MVIEARSNVREEQLQLLTTVFAALLDSNVVTAAELQTGSPPLP